MFEGKERKTRRNARTRELKKKYFSVFDHLMRIRIVEHFYLFLYLLSFPIFCIYFVFRKYVVLFWMKIKD